MDFNEKIFELRKASGLSQEETANRLGVSRQSVSKWETGQSAPEMEKLPAISELYGVSLDYLLKPSEVDALSIKTARLEAQQKQLEKAVHKKHTASFLVVSIIVGFLLFLAGNMMVLNGVYTAPDPREILIERIGYIPALLFVIAGGVVLANYIHSRKSK